MHLAQFDIKKASAEPPPLLRHHKKLLQEAGAPQESAIEKGLWLSVMVIRWGLRAVLLRAWASDLPHSLTRFTSSWATLLSSFTFFSLLLYACVLFYLRFARHAITSVSLNRALAFFNLSWALALVLTALASTVPGQQLVAAEAIGILSGFSYPHAIIANLFIHLLPCHLPPRERLSCPSQTREETPKRASFSTICSVCVQIFFMALWILYPIARILDSHYLKSPYMLALFMVSTLVSTVCFIVFFCSAVGLVVSEYKEFPMLL